MNPRISIITPSFNQGNYLEETINSVLDQNYPNLEYIVVDGGSTDNSVAIIKKYERYLHYWVSESDKGQSEAINKGLAIASGVVLNWLNSDDFYMPDTLVTVGEAFKDAAVNVVCGRSRLFKGTDETVRYSQGTDVYPGNLAKTIGWARIDQPETFTRRSAIQKMGKLNQNFHYVMDKEWWLRYLLHFGLSGIKKIDEVFVNFRLHEESKTVSQSKKFEEETNHLYLCLAEYYGLLQEAEVLKKLQSTIDHQHRLLNYPNINSAAVRAMLHYYLLYKADYLYYINNRELSKFCLQHIDTAMLQHHDINLYNQLRLKNSLVPVWLKKLMKK